MGGGIIVGRLLRGTIVNDPGGLLWEGGTIVGGAS